MKRVVTCLDLSIVMINYNTKKLTEQAIQSILDTKPLCSFEIIIVDNSNQPEQFFTQQFANTKILSGVENRGFAHGCNTGAAVAQGDYLLFLNSDTIMNKNTLDASVEYLQQHTEVGGLGVQVVLQNGELDHACKRGFPTPWNAFCYFSHLDRLFSKVACLNGYRLNHLDRNKIHQVDAVTGAYLLMPAKLYRQLGGFDEIFFMYGEDLDLCWKIKAAGYQVVYYPFVTCLHLKGQSGKAASNPLVKYHFYNAMLIFYNRYYQTRYPKWLTGIVEWVIRKKMPRLDGEPA